MSTKKRVRAVLVDESFPLVRSIFLIFPLDLFLDFPRAVRSILEVYAGVSYRAEVRRSFITTTVRDESQVTPQGRHR